MDMDMSVDMDMDANMSMTARYKWIFCIFMISKSALSRIDL
jgi:hypothetical protein